MRKLLVTILIILTNSIIANNLFITNMSDSGEASIRTITFTISWENSWRINMGANNHDAIWLFVKYSECAANKWIHADLNDTLSRHQTQVPLELYMDGKNNKGIFLRRDNNAPISSPYDPDMFGIGGGNITNKTVKLSLVGLNMGKMNFKVFGIEMVYIPSSPFYIGDGASANRFQAGNTGDPYYITSENAINVANNADVTNLYAVGICIPPVGVGAIPASFPKGYNGFYCMKYEITQGQYADFLNTLTSDQFNNRYYIGATNRYSLSGIWTNITSSLPYVAMNFMSWADLCAYLDWSALRLMTEMEYEKICRGDQLPVALEKAWGTSLNVYPTTLINADQFNEYASDIIPVGRGIINSSQSGLNFPLRVGYAANNTSDRLKSGATYYGVMEMSGNIFEFCVNACQVDGLAYTGIPGDGELTETPNAGFANQPNWPNPTSAGITVGGGGRGCAFVNNQNICQVSNRVHVSGLNLQRENWGGGRGVR